jgi:hypothetical protein
MESDFSLLDGITGFSATRKDAAPASGLKRLHQLRSARYKQEDAKEKHAGERKASVTSVL